MGRRRDLFDHRRVLLCHLVHFAHGGVHLFEAGRLFLGAGAMSVTRELISTTCSTMRPSASPDSPDQVHARTDVRA